MENNYCVYKHTSPSGKIYIGITGMKPELRWANGKGYKEQKVFYRAIQKYGWDDIKHEILYTDLSEEKAKEKEIELIAYYKSNCHRWNNPAYGYNSTDGGDLRESGFTLSENTKQKISNSDYHLNKRRKIDCFDLNGRYLKTYDDLLSISIENNVEKTNIVKCCKKEIRSLNNKIYRYNDETRGSDINPYDKYIPQNKRCVSQYDLNGKYIETFSSLSDAAKKCKCDVTNIVSCCKGIYNTCCGFIWIYGNKEEIGYVAPRCDYSTKEKSIAMYDLNGCFLKQFNSIAEAKRYIGKPNGNNINTVLSGRRSKAYGYIWKYV